MTFALRSCLRRAAHLAIGALSLGAVAPAFAVSVQFLGWNVTGSPRPTVSVAAPISQNVRAGEFQLLVDSLPETSFCIELTQTINLPSGVYTDFTLVDPSSPVLGSRAFNGLQLGRLNKLYENHLAESRTSMDKSAAFQVAVWEITYDGKGALDLGNAGFRLTGLGTVGSIASGWLSGLDQAQSGQWQFSALASPYHQDQLIARRVPVPATVAMLALGGVALGWRARRQRRAA